MISLRRGVKNKALKMVEEKKPFNTTAVKLSLLDSRRPLLLGAVECPEGGAAGETFHSSQLLQPGR